MGLTKRIAERQSASLFSSLRDLPRSRVPSEVLAGVTLLAIAVPEQLATAQLADVPAFVAILAFIAATIVFAMLGSNPILSVGADSTIAPLFAVALVRLALPNSSHYLTLVAATAVASGVIILLVGLFRLGWLADFLSAPIVIGFMIGVGLTIIVHQLPNALGLSDISGNFFHRIAQIFPQVGSANGWCVAIAIGVLIIVTGGERISKRFPFALLAVVGATILTGAAGLSTHGVTTLQRLKLAVPTWRLTGFTWHELAVVASTSLTVAIVILSQSAATARSTADEMGVNDNLNRDFVALGVANIVTGLVGTIPVNASPARTGVVRVAGGRTQLVALVAAAGALFTALLTGVLQDLPLAALAGVLFYVAGRLIKLRSLRQIWHVDRYEFALALLTTVAVISIGVQVGLLVAVIFAILDQTRRSARPHAVILGREPHTTSWEPIGRDGSRPYDSVAVLLFPAPLYFANAALFRSEVHSTLHMYTDARHVVIDAAAMTDIDFTGLQTLGSVVDDLQRENIDIAFARASDRVIRALQLSPNPALHLIRNFETVDQAVRGIDD